MDRVQIDRVDIVFEGNFDDDFRLRYGSRVLIDYRRILDTHNGALMMSARRTTDVPYAVSWRRSPTEEVYAEQGDLAVESYDGWPVLYRSSRFTAWVYFSNGVVQVHPPETNGSVNDLRGSKDAPLYLSPASAPSWYYSSPLPWEPVGGETYPLDGTTEMINNYGWIAKGYNGLFPGYNDDARLIVSRQKDLQSFITNEASLVQAALGRPMQRGDYLYLHTADKLKSGASYTLSLNTGGFTTGEAKITGGTVDATINIKAVDSGYIKSFEVTAPGAGFNSFSFKTIDQVTTTASTTGYNTDALGASIEAGGIVHVLFGGSGGYVAGNTYDLYNGGSSTGASITVDAVRDGAITAFTVADEGEGIEDGMKLDVNGGDAYIIVTPNLRQDAYLLLLLEGDGTDLNNWGGYADVQPPTVGTSASDSNIARISDVETERPDQTLGEYANRVGPWADDYTSNGSFPSTYKQSSTFLQSAALLPISKSFAYAHALDEDELDKPDFDLPLDAYPDGVTEIEKYTRRDRALSYRDLIVAKNLLSLVSRIVSVWNSDPDRLALYNTVGEDVALANNPTADNLSTPSHVEHLNDSSVPSDAYDVDEALYARDLVLNEIIARLSLIFGSEGITSIAYPGLQYGNEWSRSEGVYNGEVLPYAETSEQWGLDTFKRPDTYLAGRDNMLAAAIAYVNRYLLNVYETAHRLYLKVTTYGDVEVGKDAIAAEGALSGFSSAEIVAERTFRFTYAFDDITLLEGDTIDVSGFQAAYFFNGKFNVSDHTLNSFDAVIKEGAWNFILDNPPPDYGGTDPDWKNGGWLGYNEVDTRFNMRIPVDRREPEVYALTSDTDAERVWRAEPYLSNNRLSFVYDKVRNTVTWKSEYLTEIHTPQPVLLGLPAYAEYNPLVVRGVEVIKGAVPNQEIEVVPEVPSVRDSQFYRQKSRRLNVNKRAETSDEYYTESMALLGKDLLIIPRDPTPAPFVVFNVPGDFSTQVGKRYKGYLLVENEGIDTRRLSLSIGIQGGSSTVEVNKIFALPSGRLDILEFSFTGESPIDSGDPGVSVRLYVYGISTDKNVSLRFKALQITLDESIERTSDVKNFAGWRTELVRRAQKVIRSSFLKAISTYGVKPEFRRLAPRPAPDAVENAWRVNAKVPSSRSFTYRANLSTIAITSLPDVYSGNLTEGSVYYVVSGASSDGVLIDGEFRFNGDQFTSSTDAAIPEGVVLRPLQFFTGEEVALYYTSGGGATAVIADVDFTAPGMVYALLDRTLASRDLTGRVCPISDAPSFSQIGLPDGITLNSKTGVIEGKPLPLRVSEITSLTLDGTAVTVVTRSNHGYQTSDLVQVYGVLSASDPLVDPAQFNGEKSVTVTSPTTFTYEVPTSGSATLTGEALRTVKNPTLVSVSATFPDGTFNTGTLKMELTSRVGKQAALWTRESTDAWMNTIESIEPRLRQASRIGRPSDLGRPAIVPAGIEFVNKDVTIANSDSTRSFPTIVMFQAWMIRLGIYVLEEDFWVSKTL